ncbi:MAG: peptide chain release factor N(5)-glutamine methyltransferase [Bdellovibrionales bacterium]|nr:peptide chain release factor N(5)-glutamine methyltransferase [Bdellovibrionales bacterium]
MDNIGQALAWAKRVLENAGIQDAGRSAHVLLKFVLQCSDSKIYAHQEDAMTSKQQKYFAELIERRAKHEPVAYLVGSKEFMELHFFVTPSVLIPRPETEILIEQIEILAKSKSIKTLLDVGTGSGIIAICAKKFFPHLEVGAVDISEDALAVAKKNALHHEVDIHWKKSNLFEHVNGVFDCIVSNPPYIAKEVIPTLEKDVQQEPFLALDGGVAGMDVLQKLIESARAHLTPRGYLMMEIGHDQRHQVLSTLEQNGYTDVVFVKDFQGIDRIVKANWKG